MNPLHVAGAFLAGVFLTIFIHLLASSTLIVLPEDQWRCIEYQPGSAECALYERVGRPRE